MAKSPIAALLSFQIDEQSEAPAAGKDREKMRCRSSQWYTPGDMNKGAVADVHWALGVAASAFLAIRVNGEVVQGKRRVRAGNVGLAPG